MFFYPNNYRLTLTSTRPSRDKPRELGAGSVEVVYSAWETPDKSVDLRIESAVVADTQIDLSTSWWSFERAERQGGFQRAILRFDGQALTSNIKNNEKADLQLQALIQRQGTVELTVVDGGQSEDELRSLASERNSTKVSSRRRSTHLFVRLDQREAEFQG